ncbi:hypothetical protein SNE40_000900 [Patella caerulea]|uniref:GCS light chain n=1 Tax=Patella caerulea TaxID=87958 RepID=A0AAN8QAK0_PATCE
MSATIPIFPKVGKILVQSGNIVNWNRLKRKPNNTSTEEICECVSVCLSNYLKTADRNQLQYATELVCENKEFIESLPAEKRDDLKITVKVVLYNRESPEVLIDAVDKALSDLGVSFVETVLLAIPDIENETTVEDIKPFWTVLQTLVEQEKVFFLGICDLDKARFEQLFDWATVKPCIDQVNLASCCVMPEDLRDFAKLHNVQLLTHNDPPDVLPLQSLQNAIRKSSTDKDGDNWEPSWISRYSTIVKCRGIILTKGYVINLTRDIKRRS